MFVQLLATLLLANAIDASIRAVPGDCTKYELCDHGRCTPRPCPAGLEFNPQAEVCDYPIPGRTDCGQNKSDVKTPVQQKPNIIKPSVEIPHAPRSGSKKSCAELETPF